MNVLRIQYADEAEKVAKLRSILGRLGYRSELANPARMTVGELAKLVHRPVSTVCVSLRRPSCPPFECKRGKRRTLWIEPNEPLIAFLTAPTT